MKICIIGYGSIGKRHNRILREYFGIEAKIVRRGDEIPDADIAMICTPTDSHVPIAIECAKRDMSLFIEKPLSNSLKRLDELETIVDEKKLPTYVAYPFRHHEEFMWREDLPFAHFRCFSDAGKWPSKRKLDHVLLELSHELDISFCKHGGYELEGVVSGDTFWGWMGKHSFTLSLSSKIELREVYIHPDTWLNMNVDDDLYARQFEGFIRGCAFDMDSNIFEARRLLEKILRFINE